MERSWEGPWWQQLGEGEKLVGWATAKLSHQRPRPLPWPPRVGMRGEAVSDWKDRYRAVTGREDELRRNVEKVAQTRALEIIGGGRNRVW